MGIITTLHRVYAATLCIININTTAIRSLYTNRGYANYYSLGISNIYLSTLNNMCHPYYVIATAFTCFVCILQCSNTAASVRAI